MNEPHRLNEIFENFDDGFINDAIKIMHIFKDMYQGISHKCAKMMAYHLLHNLSGNHVTLVFGLRKTPSPSPP